MLVVAGNKAVEVVSNRNDSKHRFEKIEKNRNNIFEHRKDLLETTRIVYFFIDLLGEAGGSDNE